MAMTIVEKILARAGGLPNVSPGDFVVVNVDTAVLFDNNFSTLYWRDVLKVADPEKIVVAFDHRVPPPDKASAQAQVVGRDFVNRFGIKRFHDIGRNLGISHVVVADNGYALPGTVLVCSDTHTGAGGAFNCAARGVGGPDIIYAAIKPRPGSGSIPRSVTTSRASSPQASPRRMCSFISPTPTAIMLATTSSSAGRAWAACGSTPAAPSPRCAPSSTPSLRSSKPTTS